MTWDFSINHLDKRAIPKLRIEQSIHCGFLFNDS